jgi:hypothetical protein
VSIIVGILVAMAPKWNISLETWMQRSGKLEFSRNLDATGRDRQSSLLLEQLVLGITSVFLKQPKISWQTNKLYGKWGILVVIYLKPTFNATEYEPDGSFHDAFRSLDPSTVISHSFKHYPLLYPP